jgi:hypothetical protein
MHHQYLDMYYHTYECYATTHIVLHSTLSEKSE